MSNKQKRAERRSGNRRPAAAVDLGPVSAAHVHSQTGWHVTVVRGGDGQEGLRRLAEGVMPELFADYRQDAYGGTWSVYIGDPDADRSTDTVVTQCPDLQAAYIEAAHYALHRHPGANMLHMLNGNPDVFNEAIGLTEIADDFGAVAGPSGTVYAYPPAR